MRIERVNDNQIRCTLSKQDLNERHLKLSEIAYGSDKAKDLLRDMMQQANLDFGFETDEVPLMIEAIPVSNESIVLLITKVDNPEEFDEKFSKFSPAINGDFDSDNDELDMLLSDDETDEADIDEEFKSDTFVPLQDALTEIKKRKTAKAAPRPVTTQVIFRFYELDEIINVSKRIVDVFYGKSFVWKDSTRTSATGQYYLLLKRGGHSEDDFKSIIDLISDYGEALEYTYSFEAYLKEYCEPIVRKNAIPVLSVM